MELSTGTAQIIVQIFGFLVLLFSLRKAVKSEVQDIIKPEIMAVIAKQEQVAMHAKKNLEQAHLAFDHLEEMLKGEIETIKQNADKLENRVSRLEDKREKI
jgi:hypothetical protein